VPAPAVIPALRIYIRSVALKTFLVRSPLLPKEERGRRGRPGGGFSPGTSRGGRARGTGAPPSPPGPPPRTPRVPLPSPFGIASASRSLRLRDPVDAPPRRPRVNRSVQNGEPKPRTSPGRDPGGGRGRGPGEAPAPPEPPPSPPSRPGDGPASSRPTRGGSSPPHRPSRSRPPPLPAVPPPGGTPPGTGGGRKDPTISESGGSSGNIPTRGEIQGTPLGGARPKRGNAGGTENGRDPRGALPRPPPGRGRRVFPPARTDAFLDQGSKVQATKTIRYRRSLDPQRSRPRIESSSPTKERWSRIPSPTNP